MQAHPHLAVLRCPRTGAALRPASSAEAASAGLADAVATADGRLLYPVDDGIYILLESAAVPMLAPGSGAHRGTIGSGSGTADPLSPQKASVQQFYDDVGWSSTGSSEAPYVDGSLFEDLREVTAEYRHACNDRVVGALPRSGRYLLDAASGPIQYPDYLAFSAAFAVRVCVDFSLRALREAAGKLGDRGVCVVADVTNLPIRDGAMDGVVSLHTIYHVPSNEQATAFRELHRVLARGGRAVVVYAWGRSVTMHALHLPLRAKLRLDRMRARRGPATPELPMPELYFAPRSRRWFASQRWPFEAEVRCWRSLSVPALRAYIPASRRGKAALAAVRRLEERFPHLFGRIGQYPLIIITK